MENSSTARLCGGLRSAAASLAASFGERSLATKYGKAAAEIPQEEIAAKARFCHIIENQKLLRPLERPPALKKR